MELTQCSLGGKTRFLRQLFYFCTTVFMLHFRLFIYLLHLIYTHTKIRVTASKSPDTTLKTSDWPVVSMTPRCYWSPYVKEQLPTIGSLFDRPMHINIWAEKLEHELDEIGCVPPATSDLHSCKTSANREHGWSSTCDNRQKARPCLNVALTCIDIPAGFLPSMTYIS